MSDLDNEELEATRLLKNLEKKELDEMIKSTEGSIEETCKFLKDNSFIEYKEKSADEMFEELGYALEINTPTNFIYQNKNIKEIRFWKIQKCVEVSLIDFETNQGNSMFFTMQELQAINKKCEELRMVEIIYVICLSLVGTYFYLYVHYKKDIYGILFTLFLCIAFVLKGVV